MAKKPTKTTAKKAKSSKKAVPEQVGTDILILSLACILVATIAIFAAFA